MLNEKEKLINKLYLLCKELNRPLKKEDINKKNGFNISYNTLLRKGIKFTDLNFKKYLYDQQNKLCLNCGELIPYKNSEEKKFCNKSCAASYNNKIRTRKVIKTPKIKIDKLSIKKQIIKKESRVNFCLWCSNVIVKRKYCNNICIENLRYLNKFLDWYYNSENFTIKNPYLIKSFIETIYGYKCNDCGISSYLGQKIALQLEHIDGNALNNKKENVCLLCCNCHSQTSTYKGKNIGKGTRVRRNERYKQGKSY